MGSVSRFGTDFCRLFIGRTAALAEQNLQISAELFDVLDQHPIALRCLRQHERTLDYGNIQHCNSFWLESSPGSVKGFGLGEIDLKIFGNLRKPILAYGAKFRIGE